MQVGIFIFLFKEITLATVFIMFCFPDSGGDGLNGMLFIYFLSVISQGLLFPLYGASHLKMDFDQVTF